MLNSLWFMLLALTAGISVMIQQALNANLRTALNSAAWSGFMSYFLGVLCMLLLAAVLRDPVPTASVAARIPLWAWSGGIFGAVFIALSIVAIPVLGAATYLALLITGQMICSVTIDHFGLFGLVPAFRSSCVDGCRFLSELRKAKGTSKFIIPVPLSI